MIYASVIGVWVVPGLMTAAHMLLGPLLFLAATVLGLIGFRSPARKSD